jgi:hypothetical protein
VIAHRFVLLAAAAVTGAVLAAAQILPAIRWVGQSHRATFAEARTLYEIPTDFKRGEVAATDRGPFDGLLAKPRAGDHLEHVYYFSVGPWRLAEYVWPNISGRQFPVHRRWIEAVPAEGLAWTPTLYMGLIPLLLALGSMRLLGSSVRLRWLSWTALLAALGSFGWYGIGWLVAEFVNAVRGDPESLPFGPPAGGVYWALTVLLPGYIHFRYPAKLLVPAALGLSILAARGWDRAFAGPSPRLRISLATVGGLSLAAIAIAVAVRPVWTLWLSGVATNPLFGPLDAAGAWNDVVFAFVHTAILCGLAFWLLPRRVRHATQNNPAVRPIVALLLTAVDLAVAHSWLVPTAPRAHWEDPGPLATAIHADAQRVDGARLVRVDRAAPHHWLNASWKESASAERQAEGLRWDSTTLMPRFNLRQRIGLLDTNGTLMSQDYAKFVNAARLRTAARRGRYLHPRIQDALATDYTMLHGGNPVSRGSSFLAEYRPGGEQEAGAAVWRNERSHSRVWIARSVIRLDPITCRHPELVRRRTQEVLFSGRQVRDLRRTVIVETDLFTNEQIAVVNTRDGRGPATDPSAEQCRIVTDQPQLVAIDVDLSAPGLVVLSDFFEDGWQAKVATTTGNDLRPGQSLAVLRTNRVMRGVYLPAGEHRVEFRYRPWPFRVGGVFSLVGWGALALGVLLTWVMRRRRRRGGPGGL